MADALADIGDKQSPPMSNKIDPTNHNNRTKPPYSLHYFTLIYKHSTLRIKTINHAVMSFNIKQT
ncbi:hypothetical protein TUM3794_17560 [Shewanella colwelliana]|uniref:Uncharacterized protein n=1 Tax=Shewanella colwelliana TaxID=23 RepID=A0ABQ4NYY2_SHECO|nr:hypothetical protein TUM3794_17560 [Shewanella colwelliana]